MAIYEITNIPAPIDFECNDDIVQRTLQNAKNLLMLNMGELPYDRFRGFDRSMFHLPIQEMQAQLRDEVERAMLWDLDVEVLDASVEIDDTGEHIITAIIEIDIDPDADEEE